MATKQSTVDYILDQLASLNNVSARKMFGEYALYFDGKVVGLVCEIGWRMSMMKLTKRKFLSPLAPVSRMCRNI